MPTYDAATCSVENFVTEVLYQAFYTVNSNGLYEIAEIQIEFMLESRLELDEDFCQEGNTSEYMITQKFGIDFMVARGALIAANTLNLESIAETGELIKSGNPGYQMNQPLIVARGEDSGSTKIVPVLGTFVKGPNDDGKCLEKEQTGGQAQRLDFAKQQSTSCFVQFETYDEFKAFCESVDERANKEIFAQFLDRFKFISIFGNPNLNLKDDWLGTIFDDAASILKTAGTANDSNQSCEMATALDIEIMTSKVGYVGHTQNYVVGARAKPITKEWFFDDTLDGNGNEIPQDFSLFVSLSFTEILPIDLEKSDLVSFNLIKGNLFYPFNIKGAATTNIAWSAVTMAVSIFAILNF